MGQLTHTSTNFGSLVPLSTSESVWSMDWLQRNRQHLKDFKSETLGEHKPLNVPKLLMKEEKNITYRLQHSRFILESLWRERDRDQSAHGCGTSR